MVATVLASCGGGAPASVAELLAEACAQARERLAGAPTPTDAGSEMAFMDVSREATRAVAEVADGLATHGDDTTIADLAWQLYRFPTTSDARRALGVAQEASAAIMRIDQFAATLEIPECGAATWRPADWRAMAARHGGRPSEAEFRRELNRLCARTFPEPALLAGGAPLLDALVGDRAGRDRSSEDVKARVIARLNTVTRRPSKAARFISDFSTALSAVRPSADLEDDHVALIAAFIHLDAVVPRAMPKDPTPVVRERVDAALDGLQHAWDALEITCRNGSEN